MRSPALTLSIQALSTRLSRGMLCGISLCALTAWLAGWVAGHPALSAHGVSVLPLAIAFGLVIGHLVPALPRRSMAGIQFVKQVCLRLGIVLFGFHLTWFELLAVGPAGLALALAMLSMAFAATLYVGTRWLGMERDTCILMGAGSAICGAAAVLAADTIVRARSDQVAVAVASVVLFGTLAMAVHPLLHPYLGLSDLAYGRYVGATVHEVAQVVVAGAAVSQHALHAAVVEKILRVVMLAPFLLFLSLYLVPRCRAAVGGESARHAARRVVIPWFALAFIVVVIVNSSGWVSAAVVASVVRLDTLLLAMAMTALGLDTRLADVRRAGWRPLLLAAITALLLMTVGYLLCLWWLG